MNTEKLLKALDDESNESLINLTTDKIKEMNLNVLKELHLKNHETLDILNRLNDYIYIDEMNELKYGTYLRWISLSDPNDITLSKGALFCDIKITDNGVMIVCKNYGYNRNHFQFKMDECLIFRKLTNQEQILLSALDHLSK
jgi:hypothetical protein